MAPVVESDYRIPDRLPVGGEEGLTMDDAQKVGPPCNQRSHDNDPISVPDGNAGSVNECMICEGDHGREIQQKTHMRSTIKSEEAAMAT